MKRISSLLDSNERSFDPHIGHFSHVVQQSRDAELEAIVQTHGHVTHSHGHGQQPATVKEQRRVRLENVLMYVDCVGLGLICICTVYECFQSWNEIYRVNFHYQENLVPLAAWYAGRCAQAFALILLIFHVLGKNEGMLEAGGMYLLTIGPIINAVAAYTYSPIGLGLKYPFKAFRQKWLATEVTELIGIALLDISCFDVPKAYEWHILAVELAGYYIVALAALFEFDFGDGPSIHDRDSASFYASRHFISCLQWFPGWAELVDIRVVLSFWRVLDAFGLLLLGIVASLIHYIEHERHIEEADLRKKKIELTHV
jgi:hypothetical protein